MAHLIDRRQILKGIGFGAATLAAGNAVRSLAAQLETPANASAPGRKPNILVIMSDEHNAKVMGCAGDKVIQTPNLDSLAQSGVMFENCYCNCPICVPSRLSFTSGKYPSHVRAWSNNSMLPTEIESLPRVMNAAGYESVLSGKMHYDKTADYGFRLLTKEPWNMDGKGKRRTPEDLHPNRATYPDWEAIDKPSAGDKVAHFARVKDTTDPAATVMRQGLRTSTAALDYMSKRQAGDKPFFMVVGYEAPHYPLVVLEEHYQLFKDRVPMPAALPEGFLDKMPLNYRHLYMTTGGKHTDQEIKYARELYYALTHWTDLQIGRIIEALAKTPGGEDTIIIYTSDHGENMGEHGLWWKGCAYETASRVPLIVSYPKQWKGGQKRSGACSLLDLVQTITDLGQAKTPADWNGTSLVKWMDNPATKWKDMAVAEYYALHVASGWAMIRTGPWKYVYHTTPKDGQSERELYNLVDDPNEFKNLALDVAQEPRMKELHAALVKELGEEPEETEKRAVAELTKGYGGVKPKTLTP